MSAIVIEETVRIPAWVVDNQSFLRWAFSDEFPEQGRYSFLNNEVWADMSPEQLFWHNQVVAEYIYVLTAIQKSVRLGRLFHDRVLLTNRKVRLSTEPDGIFVSFESFRAKRGGMVKGKKGYVALRGVPDMALEVVSDSSFKKDTQVLRKLYWKAGIEEYWLVDAREDRNQFEILRHTTTGYQAVRKRAGWQKSAVFGKSVGPLKIASTSAPEKSHEYGERNVEERTDRPERNAKTEVEVDLAPSDARRTTIASLVYASTAATVTMRNSLYAVIWSSALLFDRTLQQSEILQR